MELLIWQPELSLHEKQALTVVTQCYVCRHTDTDSHTKRINACYCTWIAFLLCCNGCGMSLELENHQPTQEVWNRLAQQLQDKLWVMERLGLVD